MSDLTDEAANEILQNAEWCKFSDAREMIQEVYAMGYAHAAAVLAAERITAAHWQSLAEANMALAVSANKRMAAKDAEIAGLREYLDAAQRRGEELRAQVAALTENGPPMQRGTTIEGTPWMGTMREVLEDYKSAADTEARWGDEARAEVAGLRKALAAAIRQNEHDMLMTGEELRAARAALGDKTPTTPLPSPSPRS